MNPNEVKRRRIQGFADIIGLVTILIVGGMAGDNGVTYMAVAMMAFAFLWILFDGNTPDTLGRLLRIRNAKGQYKNAAKLRRSVMLLQMITGLAGGAFLCLGADAIGGKLFHVQYSVLLIMLLSPAFFLRGVSAVLMGFCQGEGAELPTAVACVLRQIFVLVFSLIFCRALGSYGEKVSRLLVQEDFASMYAGAGAAIAVSVSEIFVILFLLAVHKVNRHLGRKEQPEGMRSSDSFMDAVRSFSVNRAPFLAVQLLLLLPVILGFLFYGKSLVDRRAGALDYGVYFGKYLVLSLIFILLTAGGFIQLCSRTMIALRKEEQRFARAVFQGGVHITVINSLFLAVFMAVMAEQTVGLLHTGNVTTAVKLLRGGAIMLPLAALAFYFGRFLMLTGKKILVLGVLVISDLVYVLSMTLFFNVWKAGILTLVYAGIMGCAVGCVLLGCITCRLLRIGSLWLQNFLVPAGAACVTGILLMLLSKLLTPHLGNGVTLLVCAVLSAVVYWAILLVARNFKDQELEYIPGGRVIASFGQMLHVL